MEKREELSPVHKGSLPRLQFWPAEVGRAHRIHTLRRLRGVLQGQEPQEGGDGTGWCEGTIAQLCSPRVKGCRDARGSRAACVPIVRGKRHSWAQRESGARTTSRIKLQKGINTEIYMHTELSV